MNPKLHLAVLKHKLLHADRFADVMNYFFDHLGEDEEFMSLGESLVDDRLQQIIANVAASFFPKKKASGLGKIRFVRLAEHQFVHGAFFVEGSLANVIYFEDVQTGLVTMARLGGDTRYGRFTDKDVRPEIKPSRN